MAEQEKKSLVKTVADKEEFEQLMTDAGDKLVVVDFYATWCGPCKMIAPKVEQMAKELEGIVIFLKVDVDECGDVAEEQEIEAMPTFRFFRNGVKLHDLMGANHAKLQQDIDEQIKKAGQILK